MLCLSRFPSSHHFAQRQILVRMPWSVLKDFGPYFQDCALPSVPLPPHPVAFLCLIFTSRRRLGRRSSIANPPLPPPFSSDWTSSVPLRANTKGRPGRFFPTLRMCSFFHRSSARREEPALPLFREFLSSTPGDPVLPPNISLSRVRVRDYSPPANSFEKKHAFSSPACSYCRCSFRFRRYSDGLSSGINPARDNTQRRSSRSSSSTVRKPSFPPLAGCLISGFCWK